MNLLQKFEEYIAYQYSIKILEYAKLLTNRK